MKKIVFAIVLLGMLAACSFPQPTTSPSDSQTQVALFAEATLTKAAMLAQAEQTATAMAIQPTATSIPPTATSVPPTATTVPPTATNVPAATVTPVPPTATTGPTTAPDKVYRLNFATGTTNVTADGQMSANTTRRYVFWANKSQLMDSLFVARAEHISRSRAPAAQSWSTSARVGPGTGTTSRKKAIGISTSKLARLTQAIRSTLASRSGSRLLRTPPA